MLSASRLARLPLYPLPPAVPTPPLADAPPTARSMRGIRRSDVSAGNSAAGARVRSANLHRTQVSSLDVWEFRPGEFDLLAESDQSTCVLAGRAELDLADGRQLVLHPGDAVYLPRGVRGRWVVQETLRTVTASNGRAASSNSDPAGPAGSGANGAQPGADGGELAATAVPRSRDDTPSLPAFHRQALASRQH